MNSRSKNKNLKIIITNNEEQLKKGNKDLISQLEQYQAVCHENNTRNVCLGGAQFETSAVHILYGFPWSFQPDDGVVPHLGYDHIIPSHFVFITHP
jgi:hypothetical protein